MSNNDCFLKRPTAFEDEDELLRQNREFAYSANVIPSAKLVKVHDKSSSAKPATKSPVTKKSKFAQSRQKNQLKRTHGEDNVTKNNLPCLTLKDTVVEKIVKTISKHTRNYFLQLIDIYGNHV